MAKLLALTLAFAALVAFATAHTTIVTTTIDDDENPISRQRQCSQQIQQQRLNQCCMYLQQTQSPYEDNRRQGQQQQSLQQCCQELQNGDGEAFDGVLGTLAHAFAPPRGLLHLDSDETWIVGDAVAAGAPAAMDLESVAVHETGTC